MNERTIKVSGKSVIDFIMDLVRYEIDTAGAKWDILTNMYDYHIMCTDEQLVFLKIKYN